MGRRFILSVALAGLAASSPYAVAQSAKADFNGDGFSDLAVSVPLESLRPDGPNSAGAVNVLYGTARGLSADGSQFWTPISPGMLGTPFRDDRFGSALAAGDFNGDGYDDLAIGVPNSKAGFRFKLVGVIHVLYGSAGGLSTEGTQLWSQESPGILGDGRKHDRLGAALVVADFDGDGFDDLAASAPEERGRHRK